MAILSEQHDSKSWSTLTQCILYVNEIDWHFTKSMKTLKLRKEDVTNFQTNGKKYKKSAKGRLLPILDSVAADGRSRPRQKRGQGDNQHVFALEVPCKVFNVSLETHLPRLKRSPGGFASDERASRTSQQSETPARDRARRKKVAAPGLRRGAAKRCAKVGS